MSDERTGHTADAFAYKLLRERAREMRKRATSAEKVLWQKLRERPLNVKFLRQHIIGDYIADFFAYEQRLVIEVDGSYHDSPEQRERDLQRDDYLRKKNYQILRFTNEDVIYHTKDVLQTIKENLIVNL